MGTQLTLPAGWAAKFVSMPDPGERLDTLKQARLDTIDEILNLIDKFADRFGVRNREVDRAMASIDDTFSDLTYEVEIELEGEIHENRKRDLS